MFFTTSSLQYSLVLSSHLQLTTTDSNKVVSFFNMIFGTEIWQAIFIFTLQDFPFFIVRLLYLIFYQQLNKNYNLYFYVVKNFVLCLFDVYLSIVIFIEFKKKSKMIKTEIPEIELKIKVGKIKNSYNKTVRI